MIEKIIKITDEKGKVIFRKSRQLKTVLYKNGNIGFKDTEGNLVNPTDEELELYNHSRLGAMKVENGWLTFIGILTLINLIMQLVLILIIQQ